LIAKLTQTDLTSFKDGISRNSWWYWFKLDIRLTIKLAKKLEVCRAQERIDETCDLFY
jgi:hypothetical protein